MATSLPDILASVPTRLLLGPGPSNYAPAIYEAMSRPVIGHLDPQFQIVMEDLKRLLRLTLRTDNVCTFVVSGPGSAGMETAVTNLVEPGDAVAVCINGVFGERFREMVCRAGGNAIPIHFPWGTPVTADLLDSALTENRNCKMVFFVHAETSTGVLSNPAPLLEVCQQHNCISIVDVVTSLGGVPFAMDALGVDVIYSAPQKCLSGPPGLSPVSFSARAVEKVQARKSKVASWLFDITEVGKYWGSGTRQYHHTAPISSLYGLYAALSLLNQEGLEASWARHAATQQLLIAGLEKLGFELFVTDPTARLASLTTVSTPEGNEATIRSELLRDYDIEVGAGLGALQGKGFRIGMMGYNSTSANVTRLLNALAEILQ